MKSVKFIALEIFALYSITHHNDSIAVMMDFVLLPSESRLLQTHATTASKWCSEAAD